MCVYLKGPALLAYNDRQFETADYRISKSAWLNDNEVPRLAYLTNLVNSVTNLSMETAEEWQIANYGIGGQYDPHFDFARVNGN